MESVEFRFADRDTESADADGSPMPREIALVNQIDAGAERLRLVYDSTAPGTFHRKLLGTLYAVAGDYSFRIRRPRWLYVTPHSGEDEKRYPPRYSVVADPDGEFIQVAMAEDADGRDTVPAQWRPESSRTTVTVRTDEYVEEVVTSAEAFVEQEENEGETVRDRIRFLLDDAREIREAIRTEGDATGFRLAPESPKVQPYLYENHFTEPSVSYFLVQTGVVRAEVDRLRGRDTDVGAKYQALLSHESRTIQRAAANALEQHPDERAKEWLLLRRWVDRPEIVPVALRAAAQFQGEDVREALYETIDFSDRSEIRKTAVELLVEYPDEETVDILEEVAESDQDGSVREAARSVLDTISGSE